MAQYHVSNNSVKSNVLFDLNIFTVLDIENQILFMEPFLVGKFALVFSKMSLKSHFCLLDHHLRHVSGNVSGLWFFQIEDC
jgi:hypothetical protein